MSEVRQCDFMKPDGVRCGSPALRNQDRCYFHNQRRLSEIRRSTLEPKSPFPMGVPDLENANAIQGALTEVMRLLIADQIDHRRAGLLLFALQTAVSNLRQLWYADPEFDPQLDPDRYPEPEPEPKPATQPHASLSVDDLLKQISETADLLNVRRSARALGEHRAPAAQGT